MDQWMIEQPEQLTATAIFKEPNAERRRCMVERRGWDRFVLDAKLALVDSSDDPGNPGQQILLYDVPEQLYDTPIRVLLCTNGSPERDGQRRRFGLTVPADCPTALGAAAWTYGLNEKRYAGVTRRT
jgi:hypothetical protein